MDNDTATMYHEGIPIIKSRLLLDLVDVFSFTNRSKGKREQYIRKLRNKAYPVFEKKVATTKELAALLAGKMQNG